MLFKLLLTCLLLTIAGSTPHHHHEHKSHGHEVAASSESSSENGHSSESAENTSHLNEAAKPKADQTLKPKCYETTEPVSPSENCLKLARDEVVKKNNQIPKEAKDILEVEAGSEVKKFRNPSVVTPAGVIKGSWMKTRKGRRFQAYRGIRYAEPPVGMLRFEVPKPIEQYPDPVDASEEGPACPTLASEYYYPNFSEDCLRLNVYTPITTANSNASLPVIVFIHAGGFYSMSGRSDLAGPHYLLDRDLLLVTINYRLGSLGFLSTGDELAPGNNGFKDQVVALRWIKRNIRSFGGDPNSITLAGTSAGSFSVVLHMISPMSEGLFHRGIAMSGSPIQKGRAASEMLELAQKQARLVGCPDDSSRAIIDCLRTKTWRQIGDSLRGFFEFAYDPVGIWMPIVEKDFGQERFLPVDPTDAIKQKRMHAVPLLISQTTDEFHWLAFTILRNETLLKRMNAEWESLAPISFMLPKDQNNTYATQRFKDVAYLRGKELKNDKFTEERLGMLYGDAIVGFPVHRLTVLMSLYSAEKVFYYEFAYIGNHSHYEDPITKKPIGAMHHDDLIYLFSLSYRFPLITPDSADSPFVDFMTALWYNFARHGDPNPRGDLPELSSMSWPAYTPRKRQYMRLDKVPRVGDRMKENRFEVWEDLYPLEYCANNNCLV